VKTFLRILWIGVRLAVVVQCGTQASDFVYRGF